MRTRLSIILLYLLIGCVYASWTPYQSIGHSGAGFGSTIAPGSSKNMVIDDIGENTYIHFITEEPPNESAALSYGIYWRCAILDRHTGGITWYVNRTLISSGTEGVIEGYPAVALDYNHNLHVVWQSSENKSIQGEYGLFDNFEIYYKKLSYDNDSPPTWSTNNPSIRITNRMLYSGEANICCDSENNAHIVYVDSGRDFGEWQGLTDIYYVRIDNQGNPSSPYCLTSSSSNFVCHNPQIQVYSWWDEVLGRSQHNIYTAWEDSRYESSPIDSHIFYRAYIPALGWGSEIKLCDVSGAPITGWSEVEPRLVHVGGGLMFPPEEIHVISHYIGNILGHAWHGQYQDAFYDYVNNGDSWTYEEVMPPTTSEEELIYKYTYIDAIGDPNLYIHAVFNKYTYVPGEPYSGNLGIYYYKRSPEGVWSVDEPFIQGASVYGVASIVIDSHQWVHMLASKLYQFGSMDGQTAAIDYIYYTNDLGSHITQGNE